MKRSSPINTIFLALVVAFGLLVVTADRRERESVDLLRPSTLLSFVASRLHAVQAYVRSFRVSDRVDTATAGFRETVQKHESPKQSLER
jgi:cell shape-determining protein MreC